MITIITQEFRPRTFEKVAGQGLVVDTLKCVVRNPQNSPRSIILQGEFGTGKTTCSRILARALNCKHPVNGDACGKCSVCTGNIDETFYYEEYDSAMVGNVEAIKELRQSFYFNNDLGYKVVVFDECHLMSKQAQAALLKVIEEVTDNIFFVFATTDVDKVLPTIRSRSLELRFSLVDEEDIINNLIGILCSKNLLEPYTEDTVVKDSHGELKKQTVTKYRNLENYESTLRLIARRSLGHVRNANMLLDQYFLLGDEFGNSVKSSRTLFIKLLYYCAERNLEMISKLIYELQHFSLVDLKADYENLVLEITKTGFGVQKPIDNNISNIIKLYNTKLLSLIEILNSNEIYSMFNSDKQFQVAMYLLLDKINKLYRGA